MLSDVTRAAVSIPRDDAPRRAVCCRYGNADSGICEAKRQIDHSQINFEAPHGNGNMSAIGPL